MTESETPPADPAQTPEGLPQRSLLVAFGLLLGMGYLGAHRFYLGKWVSGALIPVLWGSLLPFVELKVALGLYGLFLVVDGLLISRWVRRKNAALAEEFIEHPEHFLIADAEHIAPWARGRDKRSTLGPRASALRTAIFFLALPGFTGYWAAQLHSLELLIIPLVLLAAIGLISSLDQTLARFPTVLEIPGVGPALERVAAMRAHYWEHEPKVLEALWGLFRYARTRYRPYWSLVSIVIATVIIEAILNFEDNTNYIDTIDTVRIVGITVLIAAGITLLNVVPVTALAFHYSLSGKSTRLKMMTVGALAFTILGYAGSTYFDKKDGSGAIPSKLSAMRLDSRMTDPKFRREIRSRLEFFLNYYVGSKTTESKMQEQLSMLMQSIAPNDEAVAFGVTAYENWRSVQYYHSNGACFTHPDTGILMDAKQLSKVTLELEGTEYEIPQPYSLLAVIRKLSPDEEEVRLNELRAEGKSWLQVAKAMDEKVVYYSWQDLPDWQQYFFGDAILEACRALLCDSPRSCSAPN